MRVFSVLFLSCFLFTGCVFQDIILPDSLYYYFEEPALFWEETIPLGNGRMGMMPDGGIEQENIVLNEISMWSGSPQNTDNPQAQRTLSEIRRLLFEGKNDEARQLMYETFVCAGEGSGQGNGADVPYGSYQILGNLKIEYQYPGYTELATSYKRQLNIDQAVSTVSFRKGNVLYQREYFTSFKQDVGVVYLSADREKALHFTISLDRPERYTVSTEGKDLVMRGRLNDGNEGEGTAYEARVRIKLPKGGAIIVGENTLSVENASEAILLVGTGTDYFEKRFDKKIPGLLTAAEHTHYDKLRKEHIEEYQTLFSRVNLQLEKTGNEKLPIKKRLELYRNEKNDPNLVALYFQYGRYLLISSTRPGLLPPNLQGLWCNTVHTPWNGDYHLNINLQMNLWPAEVTNLSELHLPMIEWIKEQVESGERTAKVFYNARGWVTHVLGNVWQFTAPGEHPSWGATNTSAAWLCAHLYQHYLYTLDKEYLREVYPVMKSAALFFVDMLIEDPHSHYLVTAPTTSPENAFYMPDGTVAHITAGSTMDNQLIRELFTNTIAAAGILQTDSTFSAMLTTKKERLMPTTIGRDGRIMEWLEEYKEVDPHHRHVSHLYGLYPGNEINLENTPALAEAAKKTLEVRGDQSTGWSMAWKINFWARLQEGNHAHKLVGDLLQPCLSAGETQAKKGGTYPNLFCSHPPFQIDGNFGACAGIAEMLLQSHTGEILLLPALPDAWAKGYFKGLKVRGGGIVSAEWSNHTIRKMMLEATTKNTFKIKLPENVSDLQVQINKRKVSLPVRNREIVVEMETGDNLLIQF